MKEDITTQKRKVFENFKNFVQVLAEKYSPLQIIVFAEKTITEHTNRCFGDVMCGQQFYCSLLVITEDQLQNGHQMQDFANANYGWGKITILAHTQSAVDEAIQNKNYFFNTILRNGQLLYCKGMLRYSDLTPVHFSHEQIQQMDQHFQLKLAMANGFLSSAGLCLETEQFVICIFQLHQVVEQCCTAMISLFMSYRFEKHQLYRLLHICRSFSDAPYNHFLSGGKESRKLFNLLTRSYAQARHNTKFTAGQEEARQLYKLVSSFVKLCRNLGKIRINTFCVQD